MSDSQNTENLNDMKGEGKTIKKLYHKEELNHRLSQFKSLVSNYEAITPQIHSRIVYSTHKQNTYQKRKDLSFIISIPHSQKTEAERLQKQFDKSTELSKHIRIKCSVDLSCKFHPVEKVLNPKNMEELTISHEPGTILIIVFWATWYVSCLAIVARYEETFARSENKWKGKVNMVFLSLDTNESEHFMVTKIRGWNKAQYYLLPGCREHQAMKLYGCEHIPTAIITDQQGNIVFNGNPYSIDLESQIDNLLKSKSVDGMSETSKIITPSPSVESYQQMKALLNQNEIQKLLGYTSKDGFYDMYIELKQRKLCNKDKKLICIEKIKMTIRATAILQAAKVLRKSVADIKQTLSHPEYLYLSIDIIDVVSILPGEECSNCKKSLNKTDAQYYSLQDKLYYCKACGDQEDSEKKGVARFLNPHALIYIHIKDESLIEPVLQSRLGDQIQAKTEEEEELYKYHGGIKCNGCKTNLGKDVRWKCVNCLNTEICQKCFDKLEKPDTSLVEFFKTTYSHNTESHILQRYHLSERS